MTINYHNVLKNRGFTGVLKNFLRIKDEGEIDDFVCKGRDDKKVEMIFKSDNFTKKITVRAVKDNHGMYNPESIKDNLLKILKNGTYV